MSEDIDDFQALLQRAQQGLPDAAEEFLRLFGDRVRRIIRRRLAKNPILQSAIGSSDVAQELWSKWFTDWIYHRTFPTPEEFFSFFTRAAEDAVRDKEKEFLHAQKRDLRRAQSLDAPGAERLAEGLLAHDPPPDQVVEDKDEWEHFLRSYPKK